MLYFPKTLSSFHRPIHADKICARAITQACIFKLKGECPYVQGWCLGIHMSECPRLKQPKPMKVEQWLPILPTKKKKFSMKPLEKLTKKETPPLPTREVY